LFPSLPDFSAIYNIRNTIIHRQENFNRFQGALAVDEIPRSGDQRAKRSPQKDARTKKLNPEYPDE
jgi:hypothetical protein